MNLNRSLTNQKHDIGMAVEAVRASEGPARVAILTRDNVWLQSLTSNHKDKKARLHVLLRLPAQAKIFRKQLLADRDSPTLESFDRPTCLLVIDNALAPSYNHEHMAIALRNYPGITVHKPPRAHWNDEPPPDVGPINPTPPHHNYTHNHPLISPSQTWYKAKYHFGLTQADPNTTPENQLPTASDKMNPTLALLGSLPSLLHKDIEEHKGCYDPRSTDRKAHPMAELVLQTTLKLHQKDIAFRSWMNRRARWDG